MIVLDFMTLAEATRRFGKLTADGIPTSYLEFETEEGTWKPQYNFSLNLVGYWLLGERT